MSYGLNLGWGGPIEGFGGDLLLVEEILHHLKSLKC